MKKRFTPTSTDPQVGEVIAKIVQNFSPDLTADNEAYDFVKGYDIDDFYSDFKQIFEQHLELTKELDGFSILPESTYKDDKFDDSNAIRFKLLKRTFGTMSQQPNPHEGVLAVKPLLVDILDDINHPGYKVLVNSQIYDNTIEVSSWSKNNRDANRGALFIEKFFTTYEPIFKKKGLNFLRYLGRGTDQLREFGTYSLHAAPVHYYLRTNKISTLYEKTLEKIVIEILLKK